jgi:hypothetical protein
MEQDSRPKKVSRKKRVLIPFDTLKLLKRDDQGSGWEGQKGYYYFKPVDKVGARQPIRQVYLNRKYLTGLFDTKKKGVYFGDMKLPDGKKYLQFQVQGEGSIRIFERVQTT